LVIGDWELDKITNPQSPIPNPQSPIKKINCLINNIYLIFIIIFKLKK